MRGRLVLLALALLVSCTPLCRAKRGDDVRYELPAGYTGWVWVEWSAADAPAAPRDGKELVVRIAPEGVARTSTRWEHGVRAERWVYPDGSLATPLHKQGDYTKKDARGEYRTLHAVYIGAEPAPPRPPPPASPGVPTP